jgi:hypothetical protein
MRAHRERRIDRLDPVNQGWRLDLTADAYGRSRCRCRRRRQWLRKAAHHAANNPAGNAALDSTGYAFVESFIVNGLELDARWRFEWYELSARRCCT